MNEHLDDWGDDDGCCNECGGSGWIVDCIDDLCQGAGYCMHGDGERPCRCNTTGEPNPNEIMW